MTNLERALALGIAVLAISAAPVSPQSKPGKVYQLPANDQDLTIIQLGMDNIGKLCDSSNPQGAQACAVAAQWPILKRKWIEAVKKQR